MLKKKFSNVQRRLGMQLRRIQIYPSYLFYKRVVDPNNPLLRNAPVEQKKTIVIPV